MTRHGGVILHDISMMGMRQKKTGKRLALCKVARINTQPRTHRMENKAYKILQQRLDEVEASHARL